jgi:hypothetical protein
MLAKQKNEGRRAKTHNVFVGHSNQSVGLHNNVLQFMVAHI